MRNTDIKNIYTGEGGVWGIVQGEEYKKLPTLVKQYELQYEGPIQKLNKADTQK